MMTTCTILIACVEEFRSGHLPREILDAYRGPSPRDLPNPIIMHSESTASREQLLHELRDRLQTQLLALKTDYGIEPARGETLLSTLSLLFRAMQDKPPSIT